jgi:hypothetical protein
MFGKTIAEYFRFEKWVLAAILAVGFLRLALSLAGVPVGVVRVFSVTAVSAVGLVYCGVAAVTSGFGTYRHLLPLLLFQSILVHGLAVLAIAMAALTGRENVFTAPEYTNLPNFLPHALGHLAAMLIVPLVSWPVASVVMWVTTMARAGSRTEARG